MVENPDNIYVTCIHHTDGINDYYYDSIPAKDCKLQKKYVEMIEEKDEQLPDKDGEIFCSFPNQSLGSIKLSRMISMHTI